MSESQRPSRGTRKDYSRLNTYGLSPERDTITLLESSDSSEGDEFMVEPSDNEASNSQMDSQIESQNPSSSLDLGKIYSIFIVLNY
jgi:hypothetical protein